MKVKIWKGRLTNFWMWTCRDCGEASWGVTHPIALWLALEHIRSIHPKPETTT